MPHSLTDIPELQHFRVGRGLVRIPMEVDVPFTPRVRALVDAPEFQRLAQVSQLGLVSRVYPGATHSRFEHALGVFHNALRYVSQLCGDSRFIESVDEHTIEVLLAASLLHDLGHWPFAHPVEDLELGSLPSHEAFAAAFLSDDRELARVLRDEWEIDPNEVLDVLVPRTHPKKMRLMRSILSGPIDIDKMDYLDRDSLHCGVPYGRNYDRNRLIQSLVVNEAGDGLAVTDKGRTAAELMVFARYVMFSEVYWHHAVRSATSMFARGFYEVHERLNVPSLLGGSEADTISALRAAVHGAASENLIEGVFGPRRVLYKRVGEFSLYQQPEIYARLRGRPFAELVRVSNNLAARISAATGLRLAETDVLIDAPPRHREVEFRIDIYFPKENVFRPLESVSPVVEALARTQFDDYVKRVRIFSSPRVADQLRAGTVLMRCLEQTLRDRPATP